MTLRQKIIATLSLTVLIFTAVALIWLGPRGKTQDGRPLIFSAVKAEDCLDVALSLYKHSEWETGEGLWTLCEVSDPRKEKLDQQFTRVKEARTRYLNYIRGWRPPWPLPDGSVPVSISPEEALGRINQAEQIIRDFPDDEVAELASFIKGILLYYTGRYEEAGLWLDDNKSQSTVPEYTSLLHIMALAKAGRSVEAIRVADTFDSEYPGSVIATDVKLWKARLLEAAGNLQAAADTARQAAAIQSSPPYARGRATVYASQIYLKSGDYDTSTKILVSIAENYPKIDVDHFLDQDFDDTKNLPTYAQRITLANYFLAKDRGYPAKRFLIPVKNRLDNNGLLLLAKALFLSGEYDSASKLLNQLSRAGVPEETRRDSCVLRARIHLRQGQYPKVISTIGSCMANYPSIQAEGLKITARAYLLSDNSDLRLKTLMRLTEKEPSYDGNDEAFLLIARYYLVNGKSERALDAFKAIDRYFPESLSGAESGFWQARLALDAGDLKTAEFFFKQVQEKFPYSYFNFRCGQYLLNMGLTDNSLTYPPAEPSSLLPKDEKHIRAGNALRHLNLYDLAADEYRSATETAPGDSVVGIARNLRDSGDIMASVKELEKQITADKSFYTRLMADPSLYELMYPSLYGDKLEIEARKYGIDPVWLSALIRQESRFSPQARSRSNAIGLMQIIPSTGQWIAEKTGIGNFQTAMLYDPETNINFGAWYFNYLVTRFGGDYTLAVAAYNGGPGNVSRWLNKFNVNDIDLFIESIPRDETRDYVKKVLHNYFVYKQLKSNAMPYPFD